jgi:CBS-domain-containing membrane protein
MQTVRRLKSNRVDWALALDRPTLEEPALRVDSIMSKNVFACRASDSVDVPAQLMWEHDCGSVAVVDGAGHVVGMITDRDICMAAHLQGHKLSEIPVSSVCSREVHTCRSDELVADAARLMAHAQVRRLPVIDADGQLVGVLGLSDLIRHLWFTRGHTDGAEYLRLIVAWLESVSRPRTVQTPQLPPLTEDDKEYFAQFDTP